MEKPEIQQTTLGNGLQVYGAELPHIHSVALAICARAGNFFDGRENWSASHILEHIILRGNEEYPRPDATVYQAGGDFNGTTAPDYLEFNASVHPDNLADTLRMFFSLIARPVISTKHLELEKKIILNEVNDASGDIQQVVADVIARETFPDMDVTYASEPDLEYFHNVSETDIQKIHERYFCGRNMAVAISGQFELEEILPVIEETFGTLKAGTPVDYKITERSRELPLIDTIPFPFEPAKFVMTFAGRRDELGVAEFTVLDDYLINSPDSYLFQLVRQESGLCYMLDSSLELYDEFYLYHLHFECPSENIEEVHRHVSETIKTMTSELMSEETYARLLSKRQKGVHILLDNAEYMSIAMGNDAVKFGEFFSPWEIIEAMKRATPESVLALAKTIFDPSRMHILISGDLSRKKFRQMVKGFSDLYPGLKPSKDSGIFLRPSIGERLFGWLPSSS